MTIGAEGDLHHDKRALHVSSAIVAPETVHLVPRKAAVEEGLLLVRILAILFAHVAFVAKAA